MQRLLTCFTTLRAGTWTICALLIGIMNWGNKPIVANDGDAQSKPVRFLREWGKQGSEPGDFHFPIGIAISRVDEVFVTDHYNNRVQKFDSDGKLLACFETLPNPGGIAVDDSGSLYISHFPAARLGKETTPDRVSVYSANGKLLREWGKSGTGDGEFSWPGGIAISRSGRVYVADQTNRRVQVFDREGMFLAKWGAYGTQPGQFGGNTSEKSRVGGPQFIAVDVAGNVYTTEASVGRVQKFTADGKFLLAWGDNDDKPGSFGRKFDGTNLQGPIAICLDNLPTPEQQVQFLRNIQRLLAEGLFVASYKFALIHALADLAVLHGDDAGAPLDLDTKDIAVKFVELYWRQCRPFQLGGENTGIILQQNTGRQAAIISQIVPP